MEDQFKKFRFRRFPVYRDAMSFLRLVRSVVEKFPKVEQFVLTSQLMRAAYSVILNIAEGSDRGSDKDFARFLKTAQGSLNEVVACFDVALDDGYISQEEHRNLLTLAVKLANQLTAFRKRLLTA